MNEAVLSPVYYEEAFWCAESQLGWSKQSPPFFSHWLQWKILNRMHETTIWELWKVNKNKQIREKNQNTVKNQYSRYFSGLFPPPMLQGIDSWAATILGIEGGIKNKTKRNKTQRGIIFLPWVLWSRLRGSLQGRLWEKSLGCPYIFVFQSLPQTSLSHEATCSNCCHTNT